MWVRESNCCSARIADDSDICSACGEHCDVDEYDTDDVEGYEDEI